MSMSSLKGSCIRQPGSPRAVHLGHQKYLNAALDSTKALMSTMASLVEISRRRIGEKWPDITRRTLRTAKKRVKVSKRKRFGAHMMEW